MNVLEFLFHPRSARDRFLKSYLLEPAGKKGGSKTRGLLCFVGELQQALPTQAPFLGTLATNARDAYFSSSSSSSEALFRGALKDANGFLKKESGKNRVDWLGNLHSVFLSIVPGRGEKMRMHFAKTGSARVFLIRNGSMTDIGSELDRSPHKASVGGGYGAIGSGAVIPGDRILVLSPDVYDALQKETLLGDLAFLREERQFKELFRAKEKELAGVTGILWTAEIPVREVPAKERVARSLTAPLLPNIPSASRALSRAQERILGSVHFALPPSLHSALRAAGTIVPVALLALVLLLGFFLFRGDREAEIRAAQSAIENIQSLRLEGEQALEQNREKEANLKYQEAWAIASQHADPGGMKREEFLLLERSLESRLRELNRIERIEDPEMVFSLPAEASSLVPQRMLLADGSLFLFSPFRAEIIETPLGSDSFLTHAARSNPREGFLLRGRPAFFSDPGMLSVLEPGGSWQTTTLELPDSGFRPDTAAGFEGSVYIADSASGSILRYADPFRGTPAGSPWVSAQSERRPQDIRSMAIDGNIWALSGARSIQRYFKGFFEEELDIAVFPKLEKIAGIRTSPSLSHLFLADTAKGRIIILTKFGDLVRQYESPAFSDLRDIAPSSDGSALFVLAGSRVFRVPLDTLSSP